ncbi:MAG: class I SAM-dependent methyltransferase [Chitinispirillales bacterium]|jgi:SAM-dependent methyltransferase|nr:class I SAM-dependent methyltransferase [Chitinispirillales bacterium]
MRAAYIVLVVCVCSAVLISQERCEYDAPFVPMPLDIVNVMLELAAVTHEDMVFDLGCGDGRVVISAAAIGARGVGIDIDAVRISESEENAKLIGVEDQVKFFQTDIFQVPLAMASVVAIYLLPDVNIKLRPKLLNELKPGSRIVSHDFDMGEWAADSVVKTEKSDVYLWIVPANVSGTWNWSYGDKTGKSYSMCVTQKYQHLSGNIVDGSANAAFKELELRGDKVRIIIDEGNRGKTILSGTVKENTIEGTATLPNGSKQKWRAARTASTMTPIFFPDGGI